MNENAPLEVIQGYGVGEDDSEADDPWAYTKGEGKVKGMKKKRFRTNAAG